MADIVSFYSYKGGVGRSIALSNVAVLLAQRGKRVVCIDFDLEAGGLHTIFGLNVTDINYTLLDLLTTVATPDVPSAVVDLTSRLPEVTDGGRLWLLPTVSAAEMVRKLEVARDIPSLLKGIIERITDLYRPNFILVDSRSGFAELASAAIMNAEHLVCVLRPNKQNADGLRILLDIIDILPNPKRTFLVLSQIPDIPEAANRLEKLQSILGDGRDFGAKIPYVPKLALEESVAAIVAPNSTFTNCYVPIVDWLIGDYL